jgi:N-acetylglucosamine-6-phosphate deacetylase
MPQNLLITNCRLYNSLKGEKAQALLIKDGTIARIGEISKDSAIDNILDAGGRIVAPGFIDVHVQGAGGADALDGTRESMQTISQTCARFGTTGFLATTVFRPDSDNRHLPIIAECVGTDLGGANLIGTHLEGPFISLEKKGMISPECICAPSQKIMDVIHKLVRGSLKIMTIAPELPGSLDLIRDLVDSGIISSFGHSNASYEETLKGIEAGISHVTHLFNAMPSFHHRAPGPLLAIFETEGVSVQIITDGVHIHPGALKFAFELIGEDRCITITDGMQAMGLPDGKYVYNGIEYESKNGTARYHNGTLIGTALGLNRLVQRLMEFTGCSLDTAIKTVTENTAKLLGIEDRKGSITVGKDADLVILDSDYSVRATIVGGRVVFKRDA